MSQAKSALIFKLNVEDLLATCWEVHIWGHTLQRGLCYEGHLMAFRRAILGNGEDDSMLRRFLTRRYTARGD